MVKYVSLTDLEVRALEVLYERIINFYTEEILIDSFLQESFIWATELPFELKKAVYRFKLGEESNCLVIQNLPVNFTDNIRTPSNYESKSEKCFFTKDEIFLVLVSSLLGEVFTWDSIQEGNIINNIMPIKEHAAKIQSSGYENFFDLHTEDAFHPLSGEYLGLLCLRNPTHTATVVSSVNQEDLPEQVINKLFEPCFIIGNNLAHAVSEITHFSSILFGDKNAPYIRLNLNNIKCKDRQAADALEYLRRVLVQNIEKIILQKGEILLIDNLTTVHGRDQYEPRFDGFDRWLKRVYITDQLKSSRAFRKNQYSRIIQTKN